MRIMMSIRIDFHGFMRSCVAGNYEKNSNNLFKKPFSVHSNYVLCEFSVVGYLY